MQPNDYLNQIAPKPPKKPLQNHMVRLGIIGAGLIVLVIILSVVATSISNSRRAPAERLSVRIDTTQTIADESQGTLRSSQLRSLNSDLRLFFTNTKRDIGEPLATIGVTPQSINQSIVTEETSRAEAISQRLEDARLNAVFDRTYAREMAFQLSTVLTLLQEVYAGTSNQSARDFTDATYENLEPLQAGFENFNETN